MEARAASRSMLVGFTFQFFFAPPLMSEGGGERMERGRERRREVDALDFVLEALFFFRRALDGAFVFRVRLCQTRV